jgi:hypothetical protein
MWRPWKRWVLVGLLLVAYLLAEQPLSYLLVRSGEPESLCIAHVTLFAPVRELARRCNAFAYIGGTETGILEHLFGPIERPFFPPRPVEYPYPVRDGVMIIPSTPDPGTLQ